MRVAEIKLTNYRHTEIQHSILSYTTSFDIHTINIWANVLYNILIILNQDGIRDGIYSRYGFVGLRYLLGLVHQAYVSSCSRHYQQFDQIIGNYQGQNQISENPYLKTPCTDESVLHFLHYRKMHIVYENLTTTLFIKTNLF